MATMMDSSIRDSNNAENIENVLTEKYFLDLMKDVADENKVEKVAICLRVSLPILSKLKRKFHDDTPLLATKVLMAWRDNLTCDTVPEAVQELAKALAMADLARKSTLVLKLDGSRSAQVHTIIHLEQSMGPADRMVDHPPPDDHPITTTPTPLLHQRLRRKCTAATCGWTICYTTLGLLVIVAVAAIPTVKSTPKTKNSVSPASAAANDTVELSFSLSTVWLQSLSLSIDKDCTAVAYTHRSKCSDLYSTARVCYSQSEFSGHRVNYLLPGSYFNFTVGANYSCNTDIWITWNPDLLYKLNYSAFSCENPPPQTVCKHPLTNRSINTQVVVPVTEAAYYAHFISPLPDQQCSLSLERHICSYNVTRLEETASAVTKEPIQSDPVSVDLLYQPYSFTEVCTILHVEKNSHHHCSRYNGGTLSVKTERRQDVVLFPGLLVCLTVIVLVTAVLSHVLCVVRRRRRGRPQYQRVPSTHV